MFLYYENKSLFFYAGHIVLHYALFCITTQPGGILHSDWSTYCM